MRWDKFGILPLEEDMRLQLQKVNLGDRAYVIPVVRKRAYMERRVSFVSSLCAGNP